MLQISRVRTGSGFHTPTPPGTTRPQRGSDIRDRFRLTEDAQPVLLEWPDPMRLVRWFNHRGPVTRTRACCRIIDGMTRNSSVAGFWFETWSMLRRVSAALTSEAWNDGAAPRSHSRISAGSAPPWLPPPEGLLFGRRHRYVLPASVPCGRPTGKTTVEEAMGPRGTNSQTLSSNSGQPSPDGPGPDARSESRPAGRDIRNRMTTSRPFTATMCSKRRGRS